MESNQTAYQQLNWKESQERHFAQREITEAQIIVYPKISVTSVNLIL